MKITSKKPKIPKKRRYKVVGRVSDFHYHRPRSTENFIRFLNRIEVDLLLFAYPSKRYWKKVRAKKAWVPWSYNPAVYHPSEKHKHDITFLGSVGPRSYPLRVNINRRLPSLCKEMGWSLFTRKRPPYLTSIKKWDAHPDFVAGKNYARALRFGRVTIIGSSRHRLPIKKWTQSLGSGTCVLGDAPLNSDRLGLKDGHNYIEINKDNWAEKLKWILGNEDKRRRIAENGLRLARKKHTHKIRVKEMLRILEAFR